LYDVFSQPLKIKINQRLFMKPILINGLGTVGSRIGHLLLSMKIPVHGVKYSASLEDRKTQDILAIYKKVGPFPIAMVPGDNHEKRMREAKDVGFNVIENFNINNFKDYSVIIDATSGKTKSNYAVQYKQQEQQFLVQGGTDYDLLQHDFLSAPHAVGQELHDFNHGRQVSCNTTFCSTALGLVLQHVPAQAIASVNLTLNRRCRDPGEKKELKDSLELKKSHHGPDVMNVLPQLRGKITSVANKNAWEHFHRTRIDISFAQQINGATSSAILQSFKNYPRCIVADLGNDIREAIITLRRISDRLNIDDGDCLLPVYDITQTGPTSITITGYTPQRSIVALSCVDWIWYATGKMSNWHDAFNHTNTNVKWHGYTLVELKKAYEEDLGLIVQV
jgi:glyceraldehyde-3-phosphate dehydrogenase/erythrose-4-phosphate dehydrogenase